MFCIYTYYKHNTYYCTTIVIVEDTRFHKFNITEITDITFPRTVIIYNVNTELEWCNLKYLSIVRFKYFLSEYHSIITRPIEKYDLRDHLFKITIILSYSTTS